MRDTFVKSLKARAHEDEKIFLMVGDLGFGVIDDFAAELPNQFLNAGIAEQNMMGMAAGLASRGRLPFVYSIANFPTLRCLEQIRNDVCYHNLPVTIVSIGAGMGYGTLGYSHYAIEDISVLRALPGIRILSPSDPFEVDACLDLILRDPQPTYLRLGKNGESKLHNSKVSIWGQPLELRSGSDYILLATGAIADESLTAANLVSLELAIDIAVYSIPVIKPLNLSNLDLGSAKAIITVEEHTLSGGFGSAILEYLNNLENRIPVRRIGLPDEIRTVIGSSTYMKFQTNLDVASIAKSLRDVVNTFST